MLKKVDGTVVHSKQRGKNHIEEGFVVSHKSDLSFLKPLREVKAPLHHKCGKMFSIETRARLSHG